MILDVDSKLKKEVWSFLKENKKLQSISEVEEPIVEEQKKYTHSEILKMMGM